MTNFSSVFALLASIPGWAARSAKLSTLHGGLNHHSYLVESDGSRYVLRIVSQEKLAGGGSRELEYRLQQQAAARGIAPAILYSDARRGLVLMEYLEGAVLTAEELATQEVLQELGDLLRKLHAQPLCGVSFDPIAAADAYLLKLEKENAESTFARRCVDIINNTPLPRERRCCHNDVVASNVVRGGSLRLLDFEYACDNEPMFDLASVLCWHNLGAPESNLLLEAYAGQVTDELSARLGSQCRLFDALQWLWLAVRQRQRPESWADVQMAHVRKRLL